MERAHKIEERLMLCFAGYPDDKQSIDIFERLAIRIKSLIIKATVNEKLVSAPNMIAQRTRAGGN